MTEPTESDEAGFDDGRELCADGNCLGVIVDGRCNVCGLAADGASRAATAVPQRAATGDDIVGAAADTDDSAAFDDDDRQLCPDGACTGLLGPDGKCKECGRSAAS